MARKVEFVDVTLKVPRRLYEYVEAYAAFTKIDPTEYLQEELVGAIQGSIESTGGPCFDPEHLMERYHIKKILDP